MLIKALRTPTDFEATMGFEDYVLQKWISPPPEIELLPPWTRLSTPFGRVRTRRPARLRRSPLRDVVGVVMDGIAANATAHAATLVVSSPALEAHPLQLCVSP